MRERETSPAPHPTTGTHTPHYTLIACSWPHETRKHPAKHTNTPLIPSQEHERPCWSITAWKTHHTHHRSDIRPAPLHIRQRTIANHTGHIVHEAISTFRESQRPRVRCCYELTQRLCVCVCICMLTMISQVWHVPESMHLLESESIHIKQGFSNYLVAEPLLLQICMTF